VTIQLAVLIAVGAAMFAVTVQAILRRRAPEDGWWGVAEANHTTTAGGVLGSAFALLVAFVMLLAFQGFLEARRSADLEARATERFFHDAELFPAVERAKLHGVVVCYARAIIRDEWPRMRQGQRSELAQGWGLSAEFQDKEVDLANADVAHAVGQLDATRRLQEEGNLGKVRRAQPAVPALLWLALITGGVLLVVYLSTFSSRKMRTGFQVLLIASIAATSALNMCVIRFLDTPFAGVAGSIQPTSMQEALDVMNFEIRREFADTRIPCDESGHPLAEGAG
jgi:hypothetical protein